MKYRKISSVVSIALLMIWLCYSIYNDLNFYSFEYSDRIHFYISNGNPYARIFYVSCKVVAIFFMNCLRILSINTIEEIFVKRNREKQKGLLFILSIMTMYVIVAFLVFPGVWWANNADEFTTISFVKNLQVQYHQGVIQSIFFAVALMIYPHPFVIILIQIVIGTAILGNIFLDNYSHNGNRKELLVLYLLSLNPCCLYFATYPMRTWMFSILFFLLCYRIYEWYQYDCSEKKKEIIVALVLVINYRTESKFLLLLVPIGMWLCRKKIGVDWWKKTVALSMVMVVSVVGFGIWNKLGNQATKITHPYLFLVAPLGELLNNSNFDYEEERYNLDKIGVIFDLKLVKEANGADTRGEIPESNFTKEQFEDGIRSLVCINLRHPINYLTSKMHNMLDSIAATTYRHVCYLFPDEVEPENIRYLFYRYAPDLQQRVAAFLAGDVKVGNVYLYYIWYAFWVPILFNIYIAGISIIKKEYAYLIVNAIFMGETVAVMLFSPIHYTIYYYFSYLIGWFLICEYFMVRNGNVKKHYQYKGE